MDNVMLIAGILAAGALALIAFGIYAVYGGFRASLCNAQVGEVYNFEYMQPLHGDSKRVLARVVEPVVKFDERTIRKMNAHSTYRRNDPKFQRTNHLVTCETVDGNVRQFYCERVKNCRKPLFGWAVA
tara:strand:+ start:3472 stop:3855 length:384 start_codon:yes stop_codon:yes gene_type:complete